ECLQGQMHEKGPATILVAGPPGEHESALLVHLLRGGWCTAAAARIVASTTSMPMLSMVRAIVDSRGVPLKIRGRADHELVAFHLASRRQTREVHILADPTIQDSDMRLRPHIAAIVFGMALQSAAAQSPVFTLEEVMIPMRDGARLQTAVMRQVGRSEPLPILLRRTPYGVPQSSPTSMPAAQKELAEDGYIWVVQNLRGRFKSEGTFLLSSQVDLTNASPKNVNETTDAYDTIDWLVKNIPNNNGKVGIYGVSYDGLTAGMTLLKPHPSLKAISEQASPADQWMNDDNHRFGALRESYAFEYAVYEQADKFKNTHFDFDIYDGYEWYLKLGPVSNINAKYLHGSIPAWNEIVDHPDYDIHNKREAWYTQITGSTVPNLNVAGFWDQEDPWGPWQIFHRAARNDPDHTNLMVAGPWFHGSWHQPVNDSIGLIPLGGHATAREFREQIEAPFFRYYLHGKGAKPAWQGKMFQTGSNSWKTYPSWPIQNISHTNLYLRADGVLSFEKPSSAAYRAYVSDPANPVPYRMRPISPTYPNGDWRRWEVADQRFVDGRPDVLTYTSAPLDHDITVTGAVAARLLASTSGTDADFVVKLIDVYPDKAQENAWSADAGPAPDAYARSLNGYQLPIAMEVRRGRYLASYETPRALVPNRPMTWDVPLREHDHVFLKGHRIMVQVQSTWFPVIDRNPQTFVPSIYKAAAGDFVKATQRVYGGSYITLPVVR
ncbi:MAG: X-Pro dipeptidyl-peptidase, partial [Gemmatimonadetes bacterium]|nr:X-Pro dipeptidyl-peptidase [Gemmatimonadota bacterium]